MAGAWGTREGKRQDPRVSGETTVWLNATGKTRGGVKGEGSQLTMRSPNSHHSRVGASEKPGEILRPGLSQIPARHREDDRPWGKGTGQKVRKAWARELAVFTM